MNEKRTGQRTIALGAPPSVLSFANIGGKFEAQGPFNYICRKRFSFHINFR